MKRSLHGGGLLTAATALVITTLAGCGGGKREYSIPQELCRVSVDPDLVEPFLPPGEKLKHVMDEFGVNEGLEGCTVYVDGHVVLSVRGEWRAKGLTTQEAANVGDYDMFGGGRYAVWDMGAATVVPCRAPGEEVVSDDGGGKGKAALFFIEVEASDAEDATEEDMKKFIRSYVKAYRQTLPCQDS